jgi:tetratricopeptide (TPR) repeat protein
MIPSVERFAEISALRRGNIAEIPYPVLLTALARNRSTAVLHLSRKPVEKQIVFQDGVAVDCRSNLVHETLGRFLVSAGLIDDQALQSALPESLKREIPLGEILMEREILDAVELYRQLRQNLARKLLDPFTWSEGEFELRDVTERSESSLEVRTPQLVLTGILKLTPSKSIMSGIRPLLGEPLVVNPAPPFDEPDLVIGGVAKRVLAAARTTPQPLDQLALTSGVPSDTLGRVVYALVLLGSLAPQSGMAGAAVGKVRSPIQATEVLIHPPAMDAMNVSELEGLKRRVLEAYLSFRRKDSIDLLELSEEADLKAIEHAYLRYARRFSPWVLEAQAPGDLSEKARALFLAGAEAYAELVHTESRGILLERRRNSRRDRANRPTQPMIATDLLDPALQYRKGLELLQSENFRRALEFLQFAADVDPQNALYRAEAAFCRYRLSPTQYAEASRNEIREAVRIDGECGLAHYYLGILERDNGQWDEAEDQLRLASRLLAPDRRPIEALKELTIRRKKRR